MKKLKFVHPELVPMNREATQGQCTTGIAVVIAQCYPGSAAGNDCVAGAIAGASCLGGTNPKNLCVTGSGVVIIGCGTGPAVV